MRAATTSEMLMWNIYKLSGHAVNFPRGGGGKWRIQVNRLEIKKLIGVIVLRSVKHWVDGANVATRKLYEL